jgi:carbon-monoxide dehydrogenase small subunit
MLAAALLESDTRVDETRVRDALSANLCRCTGYHNIVAAVCAAAAELAE